MIAARLALLAACLALAGCSGSGDGDPAEEGLGGWRIPAGVYGDVAESEATGDMGGIELHLDKGSESGTVEFVHCEGWCNEVARLPVRRGLNGVSFALVTGGRTVDITLTPSGTDGVDLSADWGGEGVETRRLPLIAREYGLAVARAQMAAN